MLVRVKAWSEKANRRPASCGQWRADTGGHGSQTNGACMQCPGESFPLTVAACEIISSWFVLLVSHHC